MKREFEDIYQKHRSNVYGVCLRILENAADAEDMTQEVFIKVFRKLDTFRGDSAMGTWIYRIAVNECLMFFKKRYVAGETTVDEMPEGSIVTNVIDKIAIAEALGQMPDGYRKVLWMHAAEGMEHEEIASSIGCTSGTSKSQFSKAKAKMRRLLGKRVNPRVYVPAMAA